uniref:Uncharacterized protein n=1 Tax=Glossina palpalis gambiensis TaxID=67801 RepID=A0A1B0B8S8_9MUSC
MKSTFWAHVLKTGKKHSAEIKMTLELAQLNVKIFITHRYVTDIVIRLSLPFKRKRTQLKSAEG